jgi:hypothetical protein
MTLRLIAVLFLCWCSAAAWASSSGNLVVNGGFNGTTFKANYGTVTDVLPSSWSLFAPTPTSLTNINVVSAANYPGFAAPNGSGFYMAYMSAAQNGTQDCLYQYITTVAGQTYTLTFQAAITSASPFLQLLPDWDAAGSNRVKLSVSGFNANGAATSSAGPMAFQTFTYTNLTASSSSTMLVFHGVDSQGAILLDNVTVTPQSAGAATSSADVPLPLWSLGALAAGLVSASWRRDGRRRNRAA